MPLSSRNVVVSSSSANKSVPFTYSDAYTVSADTELLAVAVGYNGDGGLADVAVTAVRWEDASGLNAEPLTQAVYHDPGLIDGSGFAVMSWWVLPTPTARVGQISFDVSLTSGTIRSYSFVAAEIIGGVNTASPVGATAAASGATAAAPLNLTSTVADALLLSADIHRYFTGATPFTPDAGVTELADGATGTNSLSDHGYWAGERAAATPGAYAVGVTASASDVYAIAAIEIVPAAAAGHTATSTTGAGSSASATTARVASAHCGLGSGTSVGAVSVRAAAAHAATGGADTVAARAQRLGLSVVAAGAGSASAGVAARAASADAASGPASAATAQRTAAVVASAHAICGARSAARAGRPGGACQVLAIPDPPRQVQIPDPPRQVVIPDPPRKITVGCQ